MKNANDFKEEIKKEERENVITTLEFKLKDRLKLAHPQRELMEKMSNYSITFRNTKKIYSTF